MGNSRDASGFTLLELLVALTIFALMSGFAYRGLNAILDTRQRLAQETQKLREVALVFSRIEQDMANVASRPIRDTGGQTAAPFLASTEALGDSDALLMFTRMGLPAQTGALAGLQRFGYRLRKDAVELLVWPVLDEAPRSQPQVQPLLAGVARFELRYLDAGGGWQPRWRRPDQPDEFPRAVEVALELASGERFVRLFALPALRSHG